MKADFTRSTFDERKHYRSVRMQQGRVQLDADWNEQQDIVEHRIEAETADILGPVAAPADGTGFQLTPSGATIGIGLGRLYVGGVLCENHQDGLTIDTQADLPAVDCVIVGGKLGSLPAPKGVYLGFIHVWQRHLTALEDSSIREMALGGPDTATRVKTLWQVQLLQASADPKASLNCLSTVSDWDDMTKPPTGKLAARPKSAPDPNNPCKLAPTAGYRRLDNLLYRVEMHLMSGTDPAFKWSHDNGSIVSSWLGSTVGAMANQLDLAVSTLGRDSVLAFGPGQWVELFDETNELLGLPGTLVKVVRAEGNTVTVDVTPATIFPPGAQTDIAKFPRNPRLRRWDGWDYVKNATAAADANGWFELEDGVEIKFQWNAFTFRHGDYWMFAARTATQVATASIEWPVDAAKQPVNQAPHGVPHFWGRLAMLSFDGAGWTVLGDCRPLFPSLTELTQLTYVGGDAQVVLERESLTLPRPLEVGVSMGSIPVGAATVRFTVESGVLANGTPTQDVVLTLGSRGIASVAWTLAAGVRHQYASAILLEGGVPSTTHYLPMHFSASIVESCACTVCVSARSQAGDPRSLQRAIDYVIKNGGGVVCLEAGAYALEKPLLIEGGTNFVLRGNGSRSRIVAPGAAVLMSGCNDVRLEHLVIESTTADASAAFATLGAQDTSALYLNDIAIAVDGPSPNAVAMLVRGALRDVRMQDCHLTSQIGLVGGAMPNTNPVPVSVDGLQIIACDFRCAVGAIALQLNEFDAAPRIEGCHFNGASTIALALSGSGRKGVGIEVARCSFDVAGSAIGLQTESARIADNDIVGLAQSASTIGISLAGQKAGVFTVSGNRVSQFSGAAMYVRATADCLVQENQVRGGQMGILAYGAEGIAVVAVESNQLFDLDLPEQAGQAPAVVGIVVLGASEARIAGNTLRRVGRAATGPSTTILGAAAYTSDRVQISDNDISEFAPPTPFDGIAIGAGIFQPYGSADISGNRVSRSAGAGEGDGSLWGGIYAGPVVQPTPPKAGPAPAAKSAKAARAAKAGLEGFSAQIVKLPTDVLAGSVLVPPPVGPAPVPPPVAPPPAAGPGKIAPAPSSWLIVRANQIVASGVGACAALSGGYVNFSENQCSRVTGTPTGNNLAAAPVILLGVAVTACNNVVNGASDSAAFGPVAINISTLPAKLGYTVLGNHTAGLIAVNGGLLSGTPWEPLNVRL